MDRIEEKRFPLQVERKGADQRKSIPWSVAEIAYAGYEAHCGRPSQTLERLAERGGFGNGEMDLFAPGWRKLSDENDIIKAALAEKDDEINHHLLVLGESAKSETAKDKRNEELSVEVVGLREKVKRLESLNAEIETYIPNYRKHCAEAQVRARAAEAERDTLKTALEEIVILAHDHNEPFSSKRAAAAIKEGGK